MKSKSGPKLDSYADFSVRLKVRNRMIFGFNVGKDDEYWRIGTEMERYRDEFAAIEALRKKMRAGRNRLGSARNTRLEG